MTPFKKRLKWKDKHQRFMVPEIEEAMRQLETSDNPESLGRKKKGDLADVYGYDLSHSSRLIYRVVRDVQPIKIVLLRVCSHKQSYR